MQETPRSGQQQSAQATRGAEELRALDARRDELKEQLESITERRALLTAQRHDAEPTQARELGELIGQLDQRTRRIDAELNRIDDQISALLARGVRRPSGFEQLMQSMPNAPNVPGLPPPRSETRFQFSPRRDDGLLGAMLIGQGLTFLLLLFILFRGMRQRVGASFARLAPEDTNRIDQLQRSVDVMAVEVERISEGQRFVSKLLNDQSSAVGSGDAVRVKSE
jgi:hypothetical protein